MARLIAAVSLLLVVCWYVGTSARAQFFAPLVPSANRQLPNQRFTVAEPAPIYARTQVELPRNDGSAHAAPLLAFLASFTAVASLASAGRNISRTSRISMESAGLHPSVKGTVDTAPIAMISKTFCPFCGKAKKALQSIGCTSFEVIEIDELPEEEMNAIQASMAEVLDSRTVPKVFFKGELLGGCDDTMAALRSGRLKELCQAVGALP